MRRHESSLFSRLVIRVGIVLIVGASSLILSAWYYGQTAAEKAYDQLLRGAGMQIADGITKIDGELKVDLPSSAFTLLGFAERDRVFYRIVGPDGSHVSGYPDLGITTDISAARNHHILTTETYRNAQVRVVTVARPLADHTHSGWVYVILAQTTEARRALAAEITQGAMLLVGSMIVLGLGGTLLAVRYALKPISTFALMLRRRSPEDLTPIKASAPQELQPFVCAINHFMTRLDERVVRLQQFIADAAHQIRTPLAAVSAQMDMLEALEMSQTNRERTERIKKRVDELALLTNQLLSHAMVIHRSSTVVLEEVNIVEIARMAFQHSIPMTTDPDMMVTFESEQSRLTVRGDSLSLREAIANIICNALRHGARSRLNVRVSQATERICVEVEDDGPGIPLEIWEVISRRFNAATSSSGTASGLGLAIAAEVAATHDGLLRFRERGAKCFAVILDLPAALDKTS